MTERLFTVKEIAESLGVSRKWLHNRLNGSAPKPEFEVWAAGKDPMMLWSENGLRQWHAFFVSEESIPGKQGKYSAYSDHRAINTVRNITVTWKLWWRCSPDGVMWWFSTPDGWYTSTDDGLSWDRTEFVLRPSDYHYISVSGTGQPGPATTAVVRSALALRKRLESEK